MDQGTKGIKQGTKLNLVEETIPFQSSKSLKNFTLNNK